MSKLCDGSVGPVYTKKEGIETLPDGTQVPKMIYQEEGSICLGCFKELCEEYAKKGLVPAPANPNSPF